MTDPNVFYDPAFTGQLSGPVDTRKNDCGPCAFRHLIRRWSLGVMDPSIEQIRDYMGVETAQTSIYDQADAAVGFHIPVAAVWDRYDDFSVAEARAWLEAGNYLTCVGDYDEVPLALKGDREFNGNHFIFANAATPIGPQTYDSLDDGRTDYPSGVKAPQGPIVWPWAVFNDYLHGLSDREDPDVTVMLIARRVVARKYAEVLVRPGPAETGLVGRWKTGPLEYGSIVLGQAVYGDRRWYRVWWPYEGGRIGFVAAKHVLIPGSPGEEKV